MSNEVDQPATPSKSFWVISYAALIWNLIGVATFIMTVMISDEALAAMSAAERAIYTEVPMLVTAAYGIAVLGGTLGCVLLLLRNSLALTTFIVSLIAICIQMGYSILFSPVLEVQGATALALPLLITLIAADLVWYSHRVGKKGWYK